MGFCGTWIFLWPWISMANAFVEVASCRRSVRQNALRITARETIKKARQEKRFSLPLTALSFFHFFACCFSCWALTNWTPGRGYRSSFTAPLWTFLPNLKHAVFAASLEEWWKIINNYWTRLSKISWFVSGEQNKIKKLILNFAFDKTLTKFSYKIFVVVFPIVFQPIIIQTYDV